MLLLCYMILNYFFIILSLYFICIQLRVCSLLYACPIYIAYLQFLYILYDMFTHASKDFNLILSLFDQRNPTVTCLSSNYFIYRLCLHEFCIISCKNFIALPKQYISPIAGHACLWYLLKMFPPQLKFNYYSF